MQNDGSGRESDETERNGSEGAARSWKERHGAALLATTSGLVLAVLMAMQMNC